MNALHPLAVYAAIKAHQNRKLDFPGDISAWLGVSEHSTAMLTGYLSEWAVLEDKCMNQKFNASDTCALPNNRLWPELARWYGCSEGYGLPEEDESKITTIDPGDKPTPLGYGGQQKPRFSFTLSQWATEEENQKAWREIVEKHGLTHNPFEDLECWQFADAAAWALSLTLSMNKAMNFGWTGHVDTLLSLHRAYGELSRIGMLPPLVAEARPLE